MRAARPAGRWRALRGVRAVAVGALAFAALVLLAARASRAQEDRPGPAKPAPPEAAPNAASIPLPPPRVARETPPLWIAGEVLPAAPREDAQDDLGGVVVDAAGAPVSGADVRLFASDPVPWRDRFPGTPLIFVDLDAVGRAPDRATTTDAQGRFRVVVPGGRTWRIDASEGDRAGGTFVIGGGPRPGANQVVLRPVATCAIVVRDELTRTPIEGAAVLAWHVSIEGPPTWVARTDAEGRANVRCTGHESYLVLSRSHRPASADLAPGAAEVRLDRAAWCVGRTEDTELRPLTGICVWSRGTVRALPELAFLTRSGTAGRFSLPAREGGGIDADIIGAGVGLRTSRNRPGDTRLVLDREASVEGEVVDAAGKRVDRWDLPGAERRADGTFRIPSIREGVWRLAAQVAGSAVPAEATIVVRPGAAVRGVRLAPVGPAPPVSRVRFRVEKPPGLRDADLRIRLSRDGWMRPAAPGADGSVTLDDLPVPPGTRLTADAEFAGPSVDLPFVTLRPIEVVTRSAAEPDPLPTPVLRIVPARKVTLRILWREPRRVPAWSSQYVWGDGARAGVGTTILPDGAGAELPLFVAAEVPEFRLRAWFPGPVPWHDAVHRADEIRDGVLTIRADRVATVSCALPFSAWDQPKSLAVELRTASSMIEFLNSHWPPLRSGALPARPAPPMLHFRSGPRVPFGPAVLRILDGDLLLAEREVDVAAEEVDLGVVEVPLVKVRVRVVDSLGLVVPEASVGADCTRGTVRIRSDSNGEAFLTLPSGVVAVVRATSGRAASPAVVLRNERGEGQTAQQVIPIELRLEQGAWIVLLRGGAPVTTGVSVVARALGEETNPGAASGPELDLVPGPPSWQRWIDAPFGFSPLPPGRFRLTVREGDRVWERDIECAAGRLTEVDLSR